MAACVNASTFSCHIRVYSRRSRALGGHPPVSIRVVRYPITSGAVQAISHACIQGAIQSVADGDRVTLREVAIPRGYRGKSRYGADDPRRRHLASIMVIWGGVNSDGRYAAGGVIGWNVRSWMLSPTMSAVPAGTSRQSPGRLASGSDTTTRVLSLKCASRSLSG
jgi:hypothetical protein